MVLTSGKKSTCNAGDTRDTGRETWIGKIPWRRKWQPTPVFLKSLVGYSAWGHKESDTTEAIQHTCMQQDQDSNLAVYDLTVMFSFALKDPRKK